MHYVHHSRYFKYLFDKPDHPDHRVLTDPYNDCWSSNTCLITLLLTVVLNRHEGMDAVNTTFIFILSPKLVMHFFVNMKLGGEKEKYHRLILLTQIPWLCHCWTLVNANNSNHLHLRLQCAVHLQKSGEPPFCMAHISYVTHTTQKNDHNSLNSYRQRLQYAELWKSSALHRRFPSKVYATFKLTIFRWIDLRSSD